MLPKPSPDGEGSASGGEYSLSHASVTAPPLRRRSFYLYRAMRRSPYIITESLNQPAVDSPLSQGGHVAADSLSIYTEPID